MLKFKVRVSPQIVIKDPRLCPCNLGSEVSVRASAMYYITLH